MVNSSKLNFQNIIKELLIVFFGVLIAMLLNSWNEKRKETIQAQHYLDGIYEEVEMNVGILEKAIPYHHELMKGLREKPLEVVMSLNPAQVNNFAWKLSENNVFKENIDPNIYQKLARAYQLHDYLMGIQMNAVDRMSEINILSPYWMIGAIDKNVSDEKQNQFEIATKEGWIPIFESWTYFEQKYLKLLEEILEERK